MGPYGDPPRYPRKVRTARSRLDPNPISDRARLWYRRAAGLLHVYRPDLYELCHSAGITLSAEYGPNCLRYRALPTTVSSLWTMRTRP